MRSEVITLGVDPGTGTTGLVVLRGKKLCYAGTVKTSPADPENVRYYSIYQNVCDIIREFGVEHVAVENFETFYRNETKKNRFAGLPPALAAQVQEGRDYAHDRDKVNPRSMFLMKGAQVACTLAAKASGVLVFEYFPQQWRGSNGRGTGRSIKEITRDEFNALYKSQLKKPVADKNVTDAGMIATYHETFGRHIAPIAPAEPPARKTRQKKQRSLL